MNLRFITSDDCNCKDIYLRLIATYDEYGMRNPTGFYPKWETDPVKAYLEYKSEVKTSWNKRYIFYGVHLNNKHINNIFVNDISLRKIGLL